MHWRPSSSVSLDSRRTPVVVDCLPLWETDVPHAVIDSAPFRPLRRHAAAPLSSVVFIDRGAGRTCRGRRRRPLTSSADRPRHRWPWRRGCRRRRPASAARTAASRATASDERRRVHHRRRCPPATTSSRSRSRASAPTWPSSAVVSGRPASRTTSSSAPPASTSRSSSPRRGCRSRRSKRRRRSTSSAATRSRRATPVTLADVVRLTPGVQVRDSGGPGQTRVAAAARPALGRRRRARRRRASARRRLDAGRHHGVLSNLGVIDVDRVEVLRGSASSLYGTNAVGGAINIVTRRRRAAADRRRRSSAARSGTAAVRGAHRRQRSWTGGSRTRRAALHWLVRDGVDGDDRARNAGGQGSVRAQIDDVDQPRRARLRMERQRPHQHEPERRRGARPANIPDQTIVDAVGLSLDELARANAGQPFAVGDATFVPGRNDPDNFRASHFLTTAITLRRVRVRSRQLAGQLSARRHASALRSRPARAPASRPRRCRCREFDGTIDTFEARGAPPAGAVADGDRRLRARARAATAICRTTTRRRGAAADDERHQPDRARGVRLGAVRARRSPAAGGAGGAPAGIPRRASSSCRRPGRRHPYDDVDVGGAAAGA